MDWDSAIDFTFQGQSHVAKVLSVYDGDTVKVAFPFGGTMYRWNCRLVGVDNQPKGKGIWIQGEGSSP